MHLIALWLLPPDGEEINHFPGMLCIASYFLLLSIPTAPTCSKRQMCRVMGAVVMVALQHDVTP